MRILCHLLMTPWHIHYTLNPVCRLLDADSTSTHPGPGWKNNGVEGRSEENREKVELPPEENASRGQLNAIKLDVGQSSSEKLQQLTAAAVDCVAAQLLSSAASSSRAAASSCKNKRGAASKRQTDSIGFTGRK